MSTPLTLSPTSFAALLGWWIEELQSMLPERVRRILAARDVLLITAPGGEHIDIAHSRSGKRARIGIATLNRDGAPILARELQETCRRLARQGSEIVLRLPSARVLRRRLTLPAAVRHDLASVLSFEIERLSPFRRQDVYFGHRVMAPLTRDSEITVELVLLPRAAAEPLIRSLASAGLQPDRIEIADVSEGASSITSIDIDRPLDGRKGWHRLAAPALAIAVLILVSATLYLPLQRLERVEADLTEQLAAARREAGVAAQLQAQIDALSAERTLLQSRSSGPSVLDVLAELTRRMPDDAWLQQIQLANGQLQISGYAGSAAAVVRLISESELFDTVAFRAPVTPDAELGRERFQISAAIVAGHRP